MIWSAQRSGRRRDEDGVDTRMSMAWVPNALGVACRLLSLEVVVRAGEY